MPAIATVTTRPFARRVATVLPARSIWHRSQPPKMSPCGLVSAGMAMARSAGSLSGSTSPLDEASFFGETSSIFQPRFREAYRPVLPLIRTFGGGIDHLANFGDLACRKTADLGVTADDGFILGQIHAKGLVIGDVGFHPLDIGPELPQRLVGLRRCAAQLLALETADLGNVALDDEFA